MIKKCPPNLDLAQSLIEAVVTASPDYPVSLAIDKGKGTAACKRIIEEPAKNRFFMTITGRMILPDLRV